MKMTGRCCLLLASCFWLMGGLMAQAELTGMVVDENDQPLLGATVFLREIKRGTATDDMGVYSIKNLKPGLYMVSVKYVGYEDWNSQFVVNPGDSVVKRDFKMVFNSKRLDEVIVNATRATYKMPFTSYTVNKYTLESKNLGQDVPVLLEGTPSIVVNSDAGAGFGYTGLRIRGTDPSRINVTVNGIPLNDAESQGVFWVDLPDIASSTEDIQIQRGVGTSTNGSGAFGASINLNTSKLQPEPYAGFSGTAGSFGTWKSTLNFGTGFLNQKAATDESKTPKGFTLDGRLSRIISDGYIDRASVDLKSYYFSGAYLGEKTAVRANIFSGKEVTYQAWNGVPAQYEADDELRRFNVSGTEKSLSDPHDNEVDDYTQTHYQLLFSRQLSKNLQLNLAGHYTRGFGFFEQYKANQNIPLDYGIPVCDTCFGVDNTDLIRQRWLDNDFYGGTWSLAHTTNGKRVQTTIGGAWNRYMGDHFGKIIWAEYSPSIEAGQRYYFGTGDKRDFNVFGKSLYSLTPYLHALVDVQYRQVSYEITGTDNDLRQTNADLTYRFINPKAGLTYDISKKVVAYASFAVAHKEPNRSDFTDAPQGAQPKPERLFNTEIGTGFSADEMYLSANIYHMQYLDQLVLTGNINDVGAPIRSNVPNSYRLGLELAAWKRFNTLRLLLDGNVTLSQNKIRDFTELVDNWDTGEQAAIRHGTTDIAFSPNIIAYGRATYYILWTNQHQLTASLSAKHVGQQYIDNTSNGNTVLDAYTTSDFQLRWVLKPSFLTEVSINLLVNNLFGTRYSANAWTYRYISESYDGRPDDPYTQWEGDDVYNLTGYYPQARRNFLLGVSVKL